jgi:hypothetical protein
LLQECPCLSKDPTCYFWRICFVVWVALPVDGLCKASTCPPPIMLARPYRLSIMADGGTLVIFPATAAAALTRSTAAGQAWSITANLWSLGHAMLGWTWTWTWTRKLDLHLLRSKLTIHITIRPCASSQQLTWSRNSFCTL